MKRGKDNYEGGFIVTVSPEEIRREKEKARALRRTQWWQRQIARAVCHYCGRHTPPKELTMDHIVPLIRGGRSTRGNVVPACKLCNTKKKYLLPVEWDEYLRTLRETATSTSERDDNGEENEDEKV